MAARGQQEALASSLADADAFAAILNGLQQRFGLAAGVVRQTALRGHVMRRMALADHADVLAYSDRLALDGEEAENLLRECLSGDFDLLRRDAFAALTKAIAPLVARANGEREIRVWAAGCGAGECAYALAIAFTEAAAPRVRILATETESRQLALAAEGRYARDAVAAIPPDLAARYFESEGESVRVAEAIRRLVTWHRHDLQRDPPFARIDFASCLRPCSSKGLSRLGSALTPGGVLCLSPALAPGHGFEALDDVRGLYVKVEGGPAPLRAEPAVEADAALQPERDLDRSIQTVIESLSETIVSWAPGSERILFSNEPFAQTLERTAEEIVGRPLASVVHPQAYLHKQQAMAALETQPFVTGLMRVPKPSGEIVWRSMRYTRMLGTEGELVGYLACGRDVSDERRYVEALEALAALETPIDQTFEKFVARGLAIATDLLGLPFALMSEIYGESCGVVCRSGPEPSPALRALALAQAQETARGTRDSEVEVAREGELAAFVGVAVHVAGEIYGALGFFSDRSPAFGPISDIQRGFVRHLAQWIGLKLEIHRYNLSLRRSEGELRTIFDNVAQNIWRLDRTRRIRWANAGAAEVMGLTPERVVGARADAFMARLDPKWSAHVEKVFRSQSPYYSIEARFKQSGEAPQWTSTDIVPDVEAGEPLLLVVSTDITPQKEREAELEVAIADADHSRRLFERHYRRTPVLLCSFRSDGRVVEASDLWRDKTGYAREEIVGHGLGEYMDEPSRRRAAEEVLPQLWRTGACEAVPLRFIAKSGAAMDVELSGYLSAEDSGPSLCLAALVDVTARNAAEIALGRANRELAVANDGLKKFAHVASHDLQEPLRKIKQFGDLLIADYREKLSDEALFYIDVMRDSADRMRRLIRDILEFSRSMNATMSRTRVNLADIAREIVAEFDMAVRDAGAEVKIGRLPSLLGDRTAVQLLMRNLIGNSLKYRRPGVAPQIAIKGAWTRAGDYHLSFKDNGCGVDPRFHAAIFDPFTRLHNRSEVDGSGIGLAICKSVCERQQWRIGVASAPGEGAEFIVVIPAADVLAEPRKEASRA